MKKIGKYIICGLLGKGGMSVVYKARLPFVQRIVALKLLSPHPNLVTLLGEEAVAGRFVAEAARIASLRHPNIIEILDFDFAEEKPFFTMEHYYHDLGHLMGETYRTEVPCRVIGLDKIIHYFRQILGGLARLHRAGIVHRDIKPGNLLISDADTIKICDFGLSRTRGERGSSPAHLMIGSPYYAAPEQERDPEGVDQRADIYSAGVIAHRMLTGLLPEEGILSPRNHHPEAGPGWEDFLRKALHKDPDRRFASSDAMLLALNELSEEWEERKELFCRGLHGTEDSQKEKPAGRPRGAPLKTRPEGAAEVFHCNRLMQPLRHYALDLARHASGLTVIDSHNALVWQQSGSPDPLDREGAAAYIKVLNSGRFGGCSKWRLPTVEELLRLLEPPGLGKNDCIPPIFDHRFRALWSSDRCTFISGWYVNLEIGFAGCADYTCHIHVRAVTELENA